MVLYTLFYIGQALAPNIQTLLVTRFLSGFFGVAPLNVIGGMQFSPLYMLTGKFISFVLKGIIADVWPVAGRGLATTLFSGSMFIGTVLGPIVTG